MFEVVHLAYSLSTCEVVDEVMFRGTEDECRKWLDSHCAVCWEACLNGGFEKQYWLGNKHLEIYPA